MGGGFPYEPPLAPCEAADECHGEGSATPASPNVASESDMGNRGNAPNPAKKKHKKQSGKKHGKKKSGKKKHKKSTKKKNARPNAQKKGGNSHA